MYTLSNHWSADNSSLPLNIVLTAPQRALKPRTAFVCPLPFDKQRAVEGAGEGPLSSAYGNETANKPVLQAAGWDIFRKQASGLYMPVLLP